MKGREMRGKAKAGPRSGVGVQGTFQDPLASDGFWCGLQWLRTTFRTLWQMRKLRHMIVCDLRSLLHSITHTLQQGSYNFDTVHMQMFYRERILMHFVSFRFTSPGMTDSLSFAVACFCVKCWLSWHPACTQSLVVEVVVPIIEFSLHHGSASKEETDPKHMNIYESLKSTLESLERLDPELLEPPEKGQCRPWGAKFSVSWLTYKHIQTTMEPRRFGSSCNIFQLSQGVWGCFGYLYDSFWLPSKPAKPAALSTEAKCFRENSLWRPCVGKNGRCGIAWFSQNKRNVFGKVEELEW